MHFNLGTLGISLGLDWLIFAVITLNVVGCELLIGLWLGHAHLITAPPGRAVPLGSDVPTPGIVAVCFGIFYSAPLRMLVGRFSSGMSAHALR